MSGSGLARFTISTALHLSLRTTISSDVVLRLRPESTIEASVHLSRLKTIQADVRVVGRNLSTLATGMNLREPYELQGVQDIFTGFDVTGPNEHFQAINEPPSNPDASGSVSLSVINGPRGKFGIIETHRLGNLPISERLGTITGAEIHHRVSHAPPAGAGGGQVTFQPSIITQKSNQWQPNTPTVDLLDPDIVPEHFRETLVPGKYVDNLDAPILKGASLSIDQLLPGGGGQVTAIFKVMRVPSSPTLWDEGDQWDVVGNTIQWNDTKIPAPVLGSATVEQTGQGANWTLVPHFWVITAINGYGETIASNEVTATPVNADDRLRIDWTKAPNATGYRIYRSQVTGVFTSPALVAEVGDVDTYDDDEGSTPGAGTPAVTNTCQDEPDQGSTYYLNYRNILANSFFTWDDFGNSIAPPDDSTIFDLEDGLGSGWPMLSPPVQNAAVVQQDAGGANWALIPHYWVVTALNDFGETLQSNEITATPVNIDDRILIAWDPVPGATLYKVYRTQNQGVYTSPAQLLAPFLTATQFLDSDGAQPIVGLPPTVNTAGQIQYFVLVSTNSVTGEETGRSAEVRMGPNAADDRIRIAWSSVSGADGYKVYSSTTPGVYGSTSLKATLGDVAEVTFPSPGTTTGSPVNDMNARIEISGSVFTQSATEYKQTHVTAWVTLLRLQDTEPTLFGSTDVHYLEQVDASVHLVKQTFLSTDVRLVPTTEIQADVRLIKREITTIEASVSLVRTAAITADVHLAKRTTLGADMRLVILVVTKTTAIQASTRLVDRLVTEVQASVHFAKRVELSTDLHLARRTELAADVHLVKRTLLVADIHLVFLSTMDADLHLVKRTSLGASMVLAPTNPVGIIGSNRWNRGFDGPGWGF